MVLTAAVAALVTACQHGGGPGVALALKTRIFDPPQTQQSRAYLQS
jgi:hypothetical protein